MIVWPSGPGFCCSAAMLLPCLPSWYMSDIKSLSLHLFLFGLGFLGLYIFAVSRSPLAALSLKLVSLDVSTHFLHPSFALDFSCCLQPLRHDMTIKCRVHFMPGLAEFTEAKDQFDKTQAATAATDCLGGAAKSGRCKEIVQWFLSLTPETASRRKFDCLISCQHCFETS